MNPGSVMTGHKSGIRTEAASGVRYETGIMAGVTCLWNEDIDLTP